MTRIIGSDCAAMCNLINIHAYIHTARTVAEMGTGTRIGSGRAEERRKSAKNRKIVIDAVRETGEIRVERGKNVEKKGLVQ